MDSSSQQLELFSGSGRQHQISGANGNAFIGYVRGYEKAILLVIGSVVIAVVSFCLGVEKGKSIALKPVIPKMDMALNRPVADPKQDVPIGTLTAAVSHVQLQAKAGIQNYTIQLASFQSKGLAQKEAGLLKQKGLAAVVIPKGNYSILCVGSFSSKDTAGPLLSQLKKKYHDSFVRRL